MNFPTLNVKLSQRYFDEMVKNDVFLPNTSNPEMKELRRQLITDLPPYNSTARRNASGTGAYDMKVGLVLYRVLADAGLDIRTAADDGWWRFLSIRLLPDLVKNRWDSTPPERFWKGRSRIWLRAMWWTVHLTWQGSEESTRKVLESVTTDTICATCREAWQGRFQDRFDTANFRETTIVQTLSGSVQGNYEAQYSADRPERASFLRRRFEWLCRCAVYRRGMRAR